MNLFSDTGSTPVASTKTNTVEPKVFGYRVECFTILDLELSINVQSTNPKNPKK